jgi:hypothetical protein
VKSIKAATGTRNAKTRIASLFLASGLIACGGGGDETPAPAPAPSPTPAPSTTPAPTPAPVPSPAPGSPISTSGVTGVLQISGDATRFGKSSLDASELDATMDAYNPICLPGGCGYVFSLSLMPKRNAPLPTFSFAIGITDYSTSLTPIGKEVTNWSLLFGDLGPGQAEVYLAGCFETSCAPVDAATALGVSIDPVLRQVTFSNTRLKLAGGESVTYVNGTLTY